MTGTLGRWYLGQSQRGGRRECVRGHSSVFDMLADIFKHLREFFDIQSVISFRYWSLVSHVSLSLQTSQIMFVRVHVRSLAFSRCLSKACVFCRYSRLSLFCTYLPPFTVSSHLSPCLGISLGLRFFRRIPATSCSLRMCSVCATCSWSQLVLHTAHLCMMCVKMH